MNLVDYSHLYVSRCGPGSSDGIATEHGLEGPGIEFRLGGCEIFRNCPDRPWGPPSILYNRYRVFPEGKVRPGRDADHSPASSAEVMEEYVECRMRRKGGTKPSRCT
jgi:hypothetical protein